MDFFVFLNFMMKFDSIGSSTKKGFARVERCGNMECIDKLFKLWICLCHTIPFTFPHFFDTVSQLG